ncbi:MAG: hypothetical protein K2P57_11065 [Burkholderiales bacterium]|nr:hypothetical protein [Burkholderiales bacterium]
MSIKTLPVENSLYSNGVYPLLVASLGLGTVALANTGGANIRIWEVLVGVFVLFVFVRYCLGSRIFSQNRMTGLLLLPLIVSVLLSGLNANRLDLWGKQGLLLSLMLVLFFVVSQRWSRVQILQNMRWVIYPGILVAGWGILELFLDPENLPLYYTSGGFIMPRAVSLFAEPNEFSEYLALPFGFLFSAMLYRHKFSSWERKIFGLGLSVVIVAQVLSFSRGGMVVFASEILAWYLLTSFYSTGKLRVWGRKLLFFIVSLLAIGGLLAGHDVLSIVDVFVERLQGLFSGNDVTSQIRWQGIIDAIANTVASPVNFVVGMGFGNLTLLLGEGVATTANVLVDVFSELGILGLLSIMTIVGAALVLPLRILSDLMRKRDDDMLAAFFGAYLSFVGLLAGGMTYATHMLNIFWFSCGLLFAIYQYKNSLLASDRRSNNDHN